LHALFADVTDADEVFALWLRKPHWGRGFSGEVTDALVHAAFECLDAPFVVAGCLTANDRSRRAIEAFVRRYAGAYFGSPPIVSSGAADSVSDAADGDENAVVPHHEWAITREQYDSGDIGLSTLVPGVAYDALDF
jgi:RimJ/RimL family protein N-acetyltransferase